MPTTPSDRPKYFELSYLTDRHREALRRLAVGQQPRAVAKALGMSSSHLSAIRNTWIAREHLTKLQKEMDTAAARTNAIAILALHVPGLLK